MSTYDKVTEIIECESITTQLSTTSAFSFKKKGYVRLIKDYHKRSYVLECYSFINNKILPSNLKPCITINISQKELSNGQPQFKNNCKITILRTSDGVIYIDINDDLIAKTFHDKLLKCLNDTAFIDDSFIIIDQNQRKKTLKTITNSIPNLNTCKNKSELKTDPKNILTNVKIKKNDLLELYGLSEQVSVKTDKEPDEVLIKSMEKKVEKPVLNNQNSISNFKFYSNSISCSPSINKQPLSGSTNTLNIIKDLDTLDVPKQTSSIKRRRDESIETSNPNVDQNEEKNKNEIKIEQTQFTPKRNCTVNSQSNKIRTNINKTPRSIIKTNKNQENQENYFKNKNFDENDENSLLKSPIKTWNRNNSKTFGKGFSNLGNTCYMNSILQCLLNIDVFSFELLKNLDKVKKIQTKLESKTSTTNSIESINQQKQDYLYNYLCELVKARDSHNETLKIQSLKDIKNTISQEATRFSGYQQHDAHEFLCQVLDQLKDDVDKLNKKIKDEKKSNLNEIEEENTLDRLSNDLNQMNKLLDVKNEDRIDNPVVDNFQFEVTHEIECKKCKQTSLKYEQYNNLCLELPNFKTNSRKIINKDGQLIKQTPTLISIQDALDVFFKDELLNDFRCEKCNTIEEVVIHRRFHQLPRVLILHLKRYQLKEVNQTLDLNDELSNSNDLESISKITNFKLVKNDSGIKIPRYLTLKHLLTNENDLKQPLQIEKNFYSQITSPIIYSSILTPLKSKDISTNFNLNIRSPLISLNKLDENKNSLNFKFFSPQPSKKVFNTRTNFKQDRFTSTKLNNQTNRINLYDSNDDVNLQTLNEQQQLDLAMKLSLAGDSNKNKKSAYYLDGTTDLNFDSLDENEDENKSKQIENFFEKNSLKKYGSKSSSLIKNKKTRTDLSKKFDSVLNDKQFDNEEEDEDLKKAKEESLITFQAEKQLFGEELNDDVFEDAIEDPFDEIEKKCSIETNEEWFIDKFIKRSEIEQKLIDENSITGDLANSYRIIGIVNHLGSSSNSGHYISDVYNIRTKTWSSYDDTRVEVMREDEVFEKRVKTGYIFFYIHKTLLND